MFSKNRIPLNLGLSLVTLLIVSLGWVSAVYPPASNARQTPNGLISPTYPSDPACAPPCSSLAITPTLPIPTLTPTTLPVTGTVTGTVLIEGGACCIGGIAGQPLSIDVDFIASSTAGDVTEMWAKAGCGSGQGVWMPFVPQLTFTYTPPINWSGFYVSAQFKDEYNTLSPILCDDISVEGMSPPPPTEPTPITPTITPTLVPPPADLNFKQYLPFIQGDSATPTPTPTPTSTVTPTPTASLTPTPTPDPVCLLDTSPLTVVNNELTFNISNPSVWVYIITSVYIEWPDTMTQNLVEIDLSGNTFWSGLQATSPFDQTGGWIGPESYREIYRFSTYALTFTLSDTLPAFSYLIEIGFEKIGFEYGCMISVSN